jgi:hypothetical protein
MGTQLDGLTVVLMLWYTDASLLTWQRCVANVEQCGYMETERFHSTNIT